METLQEEKRGSRGAGDGRGEGGRTRRGRSGEKRKEKKRKEKKRKEKGEGGQVIKEMQGDIYFTHVSSTGMT